MHNKTPHTEHPLLKWKHLANILTQEIVRYALYAAHGRKATYKGARLLQHLIGFDLASSGRHHEEGIAPTANQSGLLFGWYDLLGCERVTVVHVNHGCRPGLRGSDGDSGRYQTACLE